ncbi:DUF1304 domain-containing protein [Protaetiibacter larvae]|uniref:DUF1304 domain-containing protein n=1 Tax=Protaetiibacter larvae TaxID=2592654 RepID=A0A5C1YCC6_9MICO|nr:DUF1304 domain-containing protein [Protaetiibacter larvae]QEO10749.1 DUF1304 domain-containing protein [Protaetiibacter larvae]
MLIIGSVFAGLAALIHVYIWVLESILWTRESTRRTFGIPTVEEAETQRTLAYNQGFYNLFLAIGVAVGVVLIWTDGLRPVGLTLALFGTLSMLLAAVVLVSSGPGRLRSAATQGTAPLLAAVFLLAGILAG